MIQNRGQEDISININIGQKLSKMGDFSFFCKRLEIWRLVPHFLWNKLWTLSQEVFNLWLIKCIFGTNGKIHCYF